MIYQSKKYLFNLGITGVLILMLAACGASNESGDIEPVKELPAPPPTAVPDNSAAQGDSSSTESASNESTTTTEQPAGDSVSAVEFSISGGAVDFCDSLTITSTGDYTLQSCNREGTTGTLNPADLEILQNWYSNFVTFQHNASGDDNLATDLTFKGVGSTEPDEGQQQMVAEWFNGLFIRLWPQVVQAPPTPTPTLIGADGLCPDVARPAMIIADFQNPGNLTVVDPNTLVACNVVLAHPPAGRVMSAAGNIYYPVFDPDTETMTIWQLNNAGEQTPLAFTAVPMEGVGPFTFVVSSDGSKIAWTRAIINADSDPPIYRNDFWAANIDGSNQVTLMEQVENSQKQFVIPVRFSADNNDLFYSLHPDGQGFGFSGRFDSMYAIPAAGGESQLIFACPTEENSICIGDVSSDGTLVYIDRNTGQVHVMSRDGSQLALLQAPVTDFVGSAIFGLTGDLAFVSAVFTQENEDAPPVPNPGIISYVDSSYAGQPQTLLSNNTVVTLWEWLDENRLAFGSLDEAGNVGTSIVTLDGQVVEVSPNYALAVLR